MLVGKGGYAILDLKHVGNSGTISGVFNYAKKLCGTGKTVVILNPSTGKEGYPASTGTVGASNVVFYYFVGSTQKKVTIGSNDSVSIVTVAPSGGASDISDLDDVAITSPSNGQVLKYNSSTHKWQNADEDDVANVLTLTGFTWDSDWRGWTKEIDSTVSNALLYSKKVNILNCGVQLDSEDTPSTTLIGINAVRDNGIGITDIVYDGEGTSVIANGTYLVRFTLLQGETNTILLVPYTLTQPS